MSAKTRLSAEQAPAGAPRPVPANGRARAGVVPLLAVAAQRPVEGMPITAATTNPHFDRIGGAPAIRRLTERFYRNMDALPEAAVIRAMHPADLSGPQETLFKYLVGWMGGPPLYAAERGQPRLRHAHLAFAVGDAERDAWMNCMGLALEEVVADAALRLELRTAFHKLASFVRNR